LLTCRILKKGTKSGAEAMWPIRTTETRPTVGIDSAARLFSSLKVGWS
jgi:hypothetical protein